jgi:hypothetical protein
VVSKFVIFEISRNFCKFSPAYLVKFAKITLKRNASIFAFEKFHGHSTPNRQQKTDFCGQFYFGQMWISGKLLHWRRSSSSHPPPAPPLPPTLHPPFPEAPEVEDNILDLIYFPEPNLYIYLSSCPLPGSWQFHLSIKLLHFYCRYLPHETS